MDNYSSYYYKRKTQKNKAYLSVIITGIIIISAFLGIISFTSNLNRSERYSTSIGLNCYLISLGTFDDLNSATIFADNVRVKGGAGYIYKNKSYNVVVSLYFEDKQAKTVMNTLIEKGEKANIIILSLPEIVHGFLEDEDKERLQSSISCLKNAVQSIYELSNSFDAGTVTSREVKQNLKKINEEIINEYEKNKSLKAFKNEKLKFFNDIFFKIAVGINEVMIVDNLKAKDLRFLNIDMCILSMLI